jgi:hypothetical protein
MSQEIHLMKGFVSMNFLLGSLSLNTHMLAQTNTPTQINPFINMNFLLGSLSFNTHMCAQTNTSTHMHACTFTHALTHMRSNTYPLAHAHTNTSTQVHACAACLDEADRPQDFISRVYLMLEDSLLSIQSSLNKTIGHNS